MPSSGGANEVNNRLSTESESRSIAGSGGGSKKVNKNALGNRNGVVLMEIQEN